MSDIPVCTPAGCRASHRLRHLHRPLTKSRSTRTQSLPRSRLAPRPRRGLRESVTCRAGNPSRRRSNAPRTRRKPKLRQNCQRLGEAKAKGG